MTLAVIDASVAVKWYVREAGSESALRLLAPEAFELLAPDLSEVANALLRQEREGQLSAEALDAALADLRRTRPRLVPASEVMDRAAILARALPHPIYDCLYLALADATDALLVTADGEFVSRCRKRLKHEPATARLRLLEELEA
jgi:predicted nucleic acid-binding protein